MLCFPQLLTGAIAQYPVGRTTVARSVVNRMADESMICLADPDARLLRWELRFQELSDAEREALEAFFRLTGGPLRTFTFLDPAGNLLRSSGDLSADVWIADGLLQVDGGRLVNAAQATQGIEQRVAAPGALQYCFSAVVDAGLVRLSLRNVDGFLRSEFRNGRVWCSGSISGESEEIRCRIEVEPGATVEVRDLLLQAQPMPGAYRATADVSGVYAQTRFAEERIEFVSDGPDLHSTKVRLVSRV